MATIAPFVDPLSPRRLAFAALKAGLNDAAQGELAVEGIIATAVPSLDRMLGSMAR